jgi:alkanesulfonate monooxygenase SsuD/methylene tetrahydromethanopterin reductase-like flavin-dependent oxidoreductase (luciferase family)
MAAWRLLRERVLAMTALWTQEQAKFHGEFVNFDPVWQYPKPKQKPHPPILFQCARRSGRARILPRCRHRTRAAGNARPELRRGAARARQECVADKWSVMTDVASTSR